MDDDMTELAVAFEPPAAMLEQPLIAALAALPRAKRAEILWRFAAAAETGNERETRLLLTALRGIADPSTRPHLDPATAERLPLEEFLKIGT